MCRRPSGAGSSASRSTGRPRMRRRIRRTDGRARGRRRHRHALLHARSPRSNSSRRCGRPARCCFTAARSGCTARPSGFPSPRMSRGPRSASTGPARRRSRRCSIARHSPAACRASCCTPGTSPVRGRRSRRRATSTWTSGAGWPSASRWRSPISGWVSFTTCTPTTSPRRSSARSPVRPRSGRASTWSPSRR